MPAPVNGGRRRLHAPPATGQGVAVTCLSMTRRVAALLCLQVAATTLAATSDRPGPFEETTIQTTHEIRVAGESLRYVAEAGRVAIRDAETGEPRGHIFYVAYRVRSNAVRPVAFVWNGGPGASSDLLHFEIAGPRRWQDGALIDNEDTWLTNTDLVLVDPVGTGFSRPAKAEYADEFYGTVGDVASITEFVRAWRLLHGAERNPILLIGESWGAGRAGSVGYALERRGIPVAALVLISGGTGVTTDPVPAALKQALRVVDLSTTALHHGRLDPTLGSTAADVRNQAESWAREVYGPALARIDELTDAEREDVTRGLARFTGLSMEKIDHRSLAISARAYREGLLAEAPAGSSTALQVFDMRLVVVDDAPAADRDTGRAEVITGYLRHTLGYATSLPYVGLEPVEQAYAPDGNFPASVGYRWNYATAELTPDEVKQAIQQAIRDGGGPPRMGPPLPSAAETVSLNPRLKVLVAAGRFDSLNSCTANEELGRRLESRLQAAYAFKCYEGGHMMYRDAQVRAQLSRDVRELAAAVD